MSHWNTPEWLHEVQDIWKQSWLGYLLIMMSFAYFCRIGRYLPPPGYAITTMAVIAGIMAIRPEMGGWEKSLWFVLLLLFGAAEIRAISSDRKEQNNTFENIASKLEIAVNQGTVAINALNENITEGRSHFDSTMAGLEDSIKTQTGGNSFCYLEFSRALNNVGGMTVVKVGKYPLRGVTARMMDGVKTAAAVNEFVKTNSPKGDQEYANQLFAIQRGMEVFLTIPDFASATRFIGGYQMTNSERQSFQIVFSAFNGSWIERMEIRTLGEKWVKAIMVEVPMTKKNHFYIDPDYPQVNGKLDVPSWPRPVNGKPEWEHLILMYPQAITRKGKSGGEASNTEVMQAGRIVQDTESAPGIRWIGP